MYETVRPEVSLPCIWAYDYHIIWCTKYRKQVLTSQIQQRLRELILEKQDDYNYQVTGNRNHARICSSTLLNRNRSMQLLQLNVVAYLDTSTNGLDPRQYEVVEGQAFLTVLQAAYQWIGYLVAGLWVLFLHLFLRNQYRLRAFISMMCTSGPVRMWTCAEVVMITYELPHKWTHEHNHMWTCAGARMWTH